MEFILSKKDWKDFFGARENFLHAGGQATPRVPHPRSQGQLAQHCKWTLWFSHVIVSQVVNPCLQWYLKIEFCCVESEIAFRDLIFASLEPQKCIFTILHSFISKFGMF